MKAFSEYDLYKRINKWAFDIARVDDTSSDTRAMYLHHYEDEGTMYYTDNFCVFKLPARNAIVVSGESSYLPKMWSRLSTASYSKKLVDTGVTRCVGRKDQVVHIFVSEDRTEEVHINERFAKIVEGCDLYGQTKEPGGSAILVMIPGSDEMVGFIMPIRPSEKVFAEARKKG